MDDDLSLERSLRRMSRHYGRMKVTTPLHQQVHLHGDGLSLAADIYGPASGQPVLFFHGGGQSRRSWRGPARRLGAAGYRAIAVDLCGHGESEWAAKLRLSARRLCARRGGVDRPA
ncbi:alpha/beta fold hydrolase [Novosphingobium sp.]|uniref:alpha/beta fold hydrolase n=1 Tax=Novosphingobium sp. TaxID=1874826 RepID=UPI0032C24A0F